MNLLLLEDGELVEAGVARVGGRKARHLLKVLRTRVGETVRVGVLGGTMGEGTVERIDGSEVWLRYAVGEAPPKASAVRLVLALPRPPMLRRILLHATTLGVKQIVLLHTARVEKSYWDSHAVREEEIGEQLRLGLEQGRDTVLPTVMLRRRFRPFVEDELATWDGRTLMAEPEASTMATETTEPTTVIVGPEGGLVPFEVELLAAHGVAAVSLGPRILRVETAVVALLARLGGG